jgi:putative ABC transport system permease protein
MSEVMLCRDEIPPGTLSLLYGVSAGDPLTYTTVPVLLGFVALAACFIPLIRATRVSPVETLRY